MNEDVSVYSNRANALMFYCSILLRFTFKVLK